MVGHAGGHCLQPEGPFVIQACRQHSRAKLSWTEKPRMAEMLREAALVMGQVRESQACELRGTPGTAEKNQNLNKGSRHCRRRTPCGGSGKKNIQRAVGIDLITQLDID
jgi:hypothetical protein